MFRSCLSEIVWFKFQIISSWQVPVWTATSQRGTFPSIVLWEDAAIGGKNQKRCEEIAKEISAVANYRMDQSFLKILVLPTTTIQPQGLSISEKKFG